MAAEPRAATPTGEATSRGAATASGAALKPVRLSEDEQDAIIECMKSVDAAPLQANSDSEVDLTGLDGVVERFVEKFDPWTKVESHDSWC
jgi:hypothetical protein